MSTTGKLIFTTAVLWMFGYLLHSKPLLMEIMTSPIVLTESQSGMEQIVGYMLGFASTILCLCGLAVYALGWWILGIILAAYLVLVQRGEK